MNSPNATQTPGLIDTHCHLNYDYSPKSVQTLLKEAGQAGVETLITIGTELASIEAIQHLSETHEAIFHTVGIHPHEAQTFQTSDLALLEKAARHPKCRAIGEIGLDYYYTHAPQEAQKEMLHHQLELALRVEKPVVIHSRDAEDDLLAALASYAKKLPSSAIPGIIHCFSGTQRFGEACLDLGFYLSFSGILTFKKADELRTLAERFPLDRMLVETDAPYLAPVPHRGQKCEPSMVKLTAMKLAQIKNISFEEVARVTTRNAQAIFQIPQRQPSVLGGA
ncbi:MAG: TatD family hydrolase [Bdellovibrionia bacterium]